MAGRGALKYLVACAAIAAAIWLAHGSRVASNFAQAHWEDALFFEHAQEHVRSFPDCFLHPLWPGLYRPLTTNCYYHLVGRLTSRRVELHHLVNLVTYGANGLLLFVFCRRLFAWPWSLVPALLFVSRVAHAEVVTNTVEFQSLLSVFFSLLALECFVQGRARNGAGWQAAACLALALGLLSKETALVVPAILLLHGWLFDERGAWRSCLAPVAVVLAWAVAFVTLLRGLSDHAPTGFVYTHSIRAIALGYDAYLLSFANLLTAASGNLITPHRIVRMAGSPVAIGCLGAIGSAAAAALLLHHRMRSAGAVRARVLLFGLAFFAIAAAPFVILQDRLYLRYGYFGHAGLAIASGVILQWLTSLARSGAARPAGVLPGGGPRRAAGAG